MWGKSRCCTSWRGREGRKGGEREGGGDFGDNIC